jgi:N-acetyl-beta-hexosaminidase
MTGRRRPAIVLAASFGAAALALLVGCAPVEQNGDIVSSLSVVPAPSSLTAAAAAPFALPRDLHVSGAPEAAETFAALVRARTGIAAAPGVDGPVTFTLEPGGAPESYRLSADEHGVVVTGADAAGLFYGAQTLAQLLAHEGDHWLIPAVDIEDAPRFAYRGVMLDVARHFHDVATVKAYIDQAASLKMNAIHLHLSDDQGWRLALSSRPKLTELASGTAVGGDPGGFYTKADYAEIVAHAAARHMIVVPEFDMPSHTHAVGLAYPELAEAPVLSADTSGPDAFGNQPPVAGQPYLGVHVGFSSLKVHDEATYDFVADVFGELAAMTPGPYLHFGGDESLATSDDDFDLFVSRVSEIIADLDKTPVAWHEAGSAAQLASGTIGQYWGYTTPTDGMDDKARAFVANGGSLILSPADAIYLDMKYDDSTPLGLTWANGPTSVHRAYDWEPGTLIDGVSDDDILGVEAPMWSETLRTLDDIDTMAFPRMAAAAEAAWSPATGTTPLRNWSSFRERVGGLGPLWTSLGIRYFASPEIDWASE